MYVLILVFFSLAIAPVGIIRRCSLPAAASPVSTWLHATATSDSVPRLSCWILSCYSSHDAATAAANWYVILNNGLLLSFWWVLFIIHILNACFPLLKKVTDNQCVYIMIITHTHISFIPSTVKGLHVPVTLVEYCVCMYLHSYS